MWSKTYNASSLQSYHCSCSCVYMKQHWCNCCHVEPRYIFFFWYMSADVPTTCLSYCIQSYHGAKFQRLHFLVTVQSNLSSTLKWQVQDRKFLLPLSWQKLVWSSEIQTKVCSWILQFHLVILFLSNKLFCIYFDP